MIKPFKLFYIITFFVLLVGCENFKRAQVETIKSFKIESLDEVISKDGVEFDKDISSDGNGSIKITTDSPINVKLYQTGDIDFDESILIYSANLRTENLDGQAYIEMWCRFPGKGQYFSKSLTSALSGTNNWKVLETPFFLKKGEIPDNVELNLVVNGSGTVWIDQIELLKRPLN
ncbi:MAG: hypothetical protein ACR2NW_05040 [Thermodesulfobacteriota bacterium]